MTRGDAGLPADAPLLRAWAQSVDADLAPFTVPGHKRRAGALDATLGRLLAADVPMYGGLDEVKLTHGRLADAERRGADLWGADWCRYSTGGSTHANQVLTLAVGRPGDTVLVARNAHRSVLSGLALADLRPVWLPAAVDRATGVPVGLDLSTVATALREHPDAAGLFTVEPGYLGASSDLPALIALAHSHQVPVLVDQAWAAHYGHHPAYPQHALALGADAMVTSAHKTLPAYSQAAVVLARTDRLDRERLERAFETGHTTSPAGSILASIDAARALLQREEGRQRLGWLAERAATLRAELAEAGLPTVSPDRLPPGRYDPAKIVVLLAPAGLDGLALERGLLERGLPVEQADRDTIVPILTLADTDQTVDRLRDALAELTRGVDRVPRPAAVAAHWTHLPTVALTPREAYFAGHVTVGRRAAEGRVSAELIAPYPPGIPLVVPGEVLTGETLDALDRARALGTRIAYAADPDLATFQVVR
ncbi:MAG TPA: aminotransferase class V-fold PLP-dependent enzyme [Dermatophilaceae bacterium]|nr:aminotransferase class V-fold PLP-dependent enzyme [Dermatophilaceae bacterium]